MRPLSYSRATAVADAVATAAADPGERVPGRRHDRGRPDPRGDRAPRPPGRHQRPAARRVEDLPGGGLRIGALARMSDVARTPAVVERYPGDRAGAAARRLGAAAQHGLDGRQPAPAHALRLPARRRLALQQARAGHAAARRSTGSTAGTRSSARASTASPPTRPTSPSRSSRSTPSSTRSARRVSARSPIDDFFLLPGDTPERRAPARARRADRRDRGARRADRPPVGLPQVPRPAVLRVRAGVGRGGAARSSDGVVADARLALGGVGTKPWRARRAEAALLGGPPTTAAFAARRGRGARAAVGPREHNAFKVELAQRAMVRAPRAQPRRSAAHDAPSARRSPGSTAPPRSPARARYSAEIAPARTSRTWRSSARRSPSGRVAGDRRRAPRAPPTACSPSSPTRPADKIAAQPHLLPSLVGQAAPGRELLPDAGRRRALRRPAGRARRRRVATSGPSTPPRWCGSSTRRRPRSTTIDAGPRPAPTRRSGCSAG